MEPVVGPQRMRAADAAAADRFDDLVQAAGSAVAERASVLLGNPAGARVAVICGPGSNGADGRVAAELLRAAGAEVDCHPTDSLPAALTGVDLVIDAGFGTGFRGSFAAPQVDPDVPVLAVDIPSGVHAGTGEALGTPLAATETVTFVAMKPGLLFEPGRSLAGSVVVADIGLSVEPELGWVTAADVAQWWPERAATAHKWHHAVWVVAGSPGMAGAAVLASAAAARMGAGYVRVSSPGCEPDPRLPVEAVLVSMPGVGWADAVLADLDRIAAVVIGPGLGRSPEAAAGVRAVARRAAVAMVIDGDGLSAIAESGDPFDDGLVRVLTPHDGEYERLWGSPVGPDRVAAARRLAEARGAVVLLKGPTTVVAAPDGRVALVTAGTSALASAGTGDVLSGLIGAALARGVEPFRAAALAAFVHGSASAAPIGSADPALGLVASDLVDRVPAALAACVGGRSVIDVVGAGPVVAGSPAVDHSGVGRQQVANP